MDEKTDLTCITDLRLEEEGVIPLLPSWVSCFALHWWDRGDGVAIAYQETLAVARITDSQISICGILSGYAQYCCYLSCTAVFLTELLILL